MSKPLQASQPWRRRCNARCRQPPQRYCHNWAVRGKTRCKFHGGMSTGPKTPEGKARVVAAMVAGRRRWVERMKAAGQKFPGGRKPGSRVVKVAKANTAARERRVVVQLPKQYRHMSLEQFLEAGKEALRQLQERFERTGSLLSE